MGSSRLGFAARKTDCSAVLTIGWGLGAGGFRGGVGEGFRGGGLGLGREEDS